MAKPPSGLSAVQDFFAATAVPTLDRLYSVAEELAERVTSHADDVGRRGDEIDAMLAQIRANMSVSPAF